jgi:phosphatidylserine/phosphatidylglycerophosphate/cardiolipin synthase-like enzyme
MHQSLIVSLALLMSAQSYATRVPAASTTKAPYALFSPLDGAKAFNQMYELIRNAENYVHMTIYSWSDGGIDKAMLDALKNGVKVKIVLHPPLAKKARTIKKVEKLEAAGAEVKIAKQNMHEKFLLVDGINLVNSSANMSGGAKTRYSEAFVFHQKYRSATNSVNSLIKDFRHEFTVLWNSARDMVTAGEDNAEALEDYTKVTDEDVIINLPTDNKALSLYSSSMNFKIKENMPSSSAYKLGKYIALGRVKVNGEQTWKVRDLLIKKINGAKKSIRLSLNHFNIRAVSDALIAAVKRGINVKLNVDNQEYKSRPNNKEMTPQFVQDWKSLEGNAGKTAPVRVKYYAHTPSPSRWLLNHHKYILIDYTPSGKGTTLLAGSYNISRNAEHKQFDNMVMYAATKYKAVFKSFNNEFERLWSLNRDEDDKPTQEALDAFLVPKNGAFLLHTKKAVALSFKEVKALRRAVGRVAKGIFSNYKKSKDCLLYRPATSAYVGCPKSKKKEEKK